jgi:TetR/AcrR family transcriptional regulator
MNETKKGRGDASRKAILGAAEEAFAQHGFDGARIDAIAEGSGYNKTLIFRYFGDKLGLYTEILKRADQEMSFLLGQLFTPLLEDETLTCDAARFRAFLGTTFEALYDYMLAHPQLTRMINWEQAEGWQTLAKIATQFEPSDLERFESLFAKARESGLLRSNLDITAAVLLALQVCWTAPAAFPIYAMTPFVSDAAHMRAQTIAFLVAGIVNDPGQ